MENSPTSDSEQDDSKKSKKTKIARNVPLGNTVNTQKAEAPKPELAPAPPSISLMERLTMERERRTARLKEAEKEETADKDDETPEVPDVEINEDDNVLPVEKPIVPKIEAVEPTAQNLEAADWETEEGSIDGSGEIPLAPSVNETFVPLPVEAEEEPLEPEAIAPEAELLEDGLESEVTPDVEVEPVSVAVERHAAPAAAPTVETPWYDAVAADRIARAHQQELDDTAYASEKRGLNRGLLAGLGLGWMVGRRGKKKAAREHEKVVSKKDEQIKQLNAEQVAAQARIETVKKNQETIKAALEQETLRAKVAEKLAATKPAEKQSVPAMKPAETIATATAAEIATKITSEKPELAENISESASAMPEYTHTELAEKPMEVKPADIPVILEAAAVLPLKAAEAIASSFKAESLPSDDVSGEKRVATAEAEKPQTELPPEDSEITEDMYTTPDGRRVETSAWHRIEIDEKTGKVVSDPEVAYGEEFKREQAKEIFKDDPKKATGSAGPAGFLGGLATASTDNADIQAHGTDTTYDDTKDGGLTVERPQADPHAHLTAGNELLRHAAKPMTWIIAGGIVVILFVIGILQ